MTGRASILPELMPGHVRAEGAMLGGFKGSANNQRRRRSYYAGGVVYFQRPRFLSKVVEHGLHADRDLASNKPACLFPVD